LEKLSTIKISLEGARPETNDWIRGENEFAQVVEKIGLIDKNRFSVVLMFTLSKRNLDELELMLALAYELGVDGLLIERFIPEGRGKNMMSDLLQAKDWEKVLGWIGKKVGEEDDIFSLLPYRAFWLQLKPEFQVLGALCNLGESLCLMPDGTFFPCRRFPYPLGNIFQNDFWEILEKSPLLQRVRKKSNLEGKCKICPIEECLGCRALAFALYHNPLAEDIQCPWE
jgi:radical SAM protein with 4Fe4S-binding SPASM domain